MSSHNEDKKASRTFLLVAIGVFILASGITWWWYCDAKKLAGNLDIEKLGQLGDSFGPLTSIFTSLADGMAVLSTYFQVREFSKQLEEMRASKIEMEKQTETYTRQLEEAKRQTQILKEQQQAEQLRHSSERLPFIIAFVNSGTREVELINRGAKVYSVTFLSDVGFRYITHSSFGQITDLAIWNPDDHKVTITFKNSDAPCDVAVNYTLHSGERIEKRFIIPFEMPVTLYSNRIHQMNHLKLALSQALA